jgi:hypothetical protein
MKPLIIVAAAVLTAACVAVSEDVRSPAELGPDAVLLVGKIEIVPRIKPEEQQYRAGPDPFNSKRHFLGRAVLFTSDKPEYREHTRTALNPPLEEVYFVKLPRAHRYVVKGSVTMSFVSRGASARSGYDQSELMFPVPIELDVRPSDKAIYVGTLRVHRDEFHTVTKVEIRDEYAGALAEYRKRFAGEPAPRKALLRRAKR